MEIFISAQLVQAGSALLVGLAAGLYYDVLRAIRRRTGGAGMTIFLDIFFWIGLLGLLFTQTMVVGAGVARIFMLAVNSCGFMVHFLIFSKFTLYLVEKCIDLMSGVIRRIMAPIRWMQIKGKKNWEKRKKSFQKLDKCYIIQKNNWRIMRKRRARQEEGVGRDETKGKHFYEAGSVNASGVRHRHPLRSPRPTREHTGGAVGTATKRGRAGTGKRSARARDRKPQRSGDD